MEKICANCQFWSNEYLEYEKPIKTLSVGTCGKVVSISYWTNEDKAEKAAENASVLGDNVYTHRNFGCVNFINGDSL